MNMILTKWFKISQKIEMGLMIMSEKNNELDELIKDLFSGIYNQINILQENQIKMKNDINILQRCLTHLIVMIDGNKAFDNIPDNEQ